MNILSSRSLRFVHMVRLDTIAIWHIADAVAVLVNSHTTRTLNHEPFGSGQKMGN